MRSVGLDLDTSAAKAKIDGLKTATVQVGRNIDNQRINLLTLYGHFSTMSNLILQRLQQAAQGTEAQFGYQIALQTSQIATTQLSIYQLSLLAASYWATMPQYSFLLLGQIGAMEYNLAMQQIQLSRTRQIEQSAANWRALGL